MTWMHFGQWHECMLLSVNHTQSMTPMLTAMCNIHSALIPECDLDSAKFSWVWFTLSAFLSLTMSLTAFKLCNWLLKDTTQFPGHVAKEEVKYSLAREHAPYNQIVNPREISNNKAPSLSVAIRLQPCCSPTGCCVDWLPLTKDQGNDTLDIFDTASLQSWSFMMTILTQPQHCGKSFSDKMYDRPTCSLSKCPAQLKPIYLMT